MIMNLISINSVFTIKSWEVVDFKMFNCLGRLLSHCILVVTNKKENFIKLSPKPYLRTSSDEALIDMDY